MAGLYFLAKITLEFLWWACIGFFIAALIIDWKVVADAGKWFVNLLKRDPLRGIVFGVLGAVCFPIVAFVLFLAALAKRRMKGMFSKFEQDFKSMGGSGENPFMTGPKQPQQDEYVDYEEIETKRKTGDK
jgi:hypothetical protein